MMPGTMGAVIPVGVVRSSIRRGAYAVRLTSSATSSDEIKEDATIIEKLCNDHITSRFHLLLQILDIILLAFGVWVSLSIQVNYEYIYIYMYVCMYVCGCESHSIEL